MSFFREKMLKAGRRKWDEAIQRTLLESANAAVHLKGKTGSDAAWKGDDGIIRSAVIDSEPWQLGHGQWIVKLKGKSGGFDCARVTIVERTSRREVPTTNA